MDIFREILIKSFKYNHMIRYDGAHLILFSRDEILLYKRHSRKDFYLAEEFEICQK